MKSIVIFDTVDPERSQVRFKSNYHDAEMHFVSTVYDLFELLEKLEKKGVKPNVIVMEAETPKEDTGMIFGDKRVRSPFAIIQFLRNKGYKFAIYTRGTKDKTFKEIKKSYERIHVEVVKKDCEKEDFRRVFDRFFIDFENAKVREF